MSAVVKTEAIVLRSINFRESSKIVTFYSRDFGKITGIVKGARRTRNRYGSALEPMSYVSLILYKREGRDIQTVAQCDLVKIFRNLREDIDKMSAGIAMIELLNLAANEREENTPLFRLIADCLGALDGAEKNPWNLLYYFELHLAGVLGFKPSFDHCKSCRKVLNEIIKERIYQFNIERGGLVCSSCKSVAGYKLPLPSGALKIFREILSPDDTGLVINHDLDAGSRRIVGDFLRMYLQYHVHGIRSLKSCEVFAAMSDGT